MSQSATLVRVAKHALDGTPIYPHHGQNAIYYQTVDTVANMKYLAYSIQRPSDQLIALSTPTVKIFVHSRIFVFRLKILSREQELYVAFRISFDVSFSFAKKRRHCL